MPDLEGFWKWCENYIKLAIGLIVVNGAGLAYCINYLSSVSPQYRVGDFIVLLSLGVILGCLFFMAMHFARGDLTTAIVTRRRSWTPIWGTAVEWSGYIGLWGSAVCFVGAILLFAFRFRNL